MLRSLNHFNQKHHHIEIVVYQHKFPALLTQYPPVAISHITNIYSVCVSSMRNGDVAFPLDVFFVFVVVVVFSRLRLSFWSSTHIEFTVSSNPQNHSVINTLQICGAHTLGEKKTTTTIVSSDAIWWCSLANTAVNKIHSQCLHTLVCSEGGRETLTRITHKL